VRVGTWNLEGRWSSAHLDLLLAGLCDVWLLTEVRDDTTLPGFHSHLTTERMGRRKHWAGIFSRNPLQPLPDPHPASAAATTLGISWCSSILPWRSCGTIPWGEGSMTQKTARAVEQLMQSLQTGLLIWGGDWNHAMTGPEHVGSLGGRSAIKQALASRRLQLATQDCPHREPGLHTIDHIAIPRDARLLDATRVIGQSASGERLSDHDAYIIEIALA